MIQGTVKDGFAVLAEGREHLEEDGGIDIEFMEFKGPLGQMRLEFVSRPVVLGKKTIYSRRIGSETAVEYQYDENDRAETLHVYRLDEASGEWVEVEAGMFA
jgi:hypothetical protein